MSDTIEIGVVGYSAQDFDEELAKDALADAYDGIETETDSTPVVVSGLTDLGIPALAYREAATREWKTVGVACAKASDFDCYPVDEREIVGEDWGDESDRFLSRIDVLVRVGGGEQAHAEMAEARERGITVRDMGDC